MSLRTLTPLLALLVASCSGAPVPVTLDQADVRTVDHATIFAKYMYPGANVGKPRQVLHLSISSQAELIRLFEDRGKQLQVRCSVDGTKDGKSYSDSAFGPFRRRTSSGERYRYDIYAYVDLQAESADYQNGKPASSIDLRTQPFESLVCQLVGVEMFPVPFLRSTELVVPFNAFQNMVVHALKQ